MSEAGRQALAAEYTRVLIMAAQARARGLDRSPEIATLQNYSNLQLLAMRLVRDFSAGGPPVSAEEVESYYREHAGDYQSVVLSRISVPAEPNHAGDGPARTAARAQAVRERAAAGGEGAAFQDESRLGPVPCLSLPDAVRPVCALAPGEVSAPIPDGAGFVIYRVESRRARGLDELREDIVAAIQRLRVQRDIEHARTPVALDLDARYFGQLPGGELAHKHGMTLPASSSMAGHDHHR